MTVVSVEARLAALEAEVARLRQKVEPVPALPWWERRFGSFANDPLYLEAMRLGREYRESLRPKRRRRREREDGCA
jgi:hypothetical protein